MKDFEKFDLYKKGETIATDNTLPVVAPSEEVKQKTDNEIYIEKLEGLLRNYREHVGWHEGIDYLRECDDSQYLTSEDMRFIKDL